MGARRIIPSCVIGLAIVCLFAGCTSSLNAQSASSLVRARPTTPPDSYAPQFTEAVRGLGDALTRLAALLADPRYLDETWKTEAVNLATLVERGYRQLDGLSAPEQHQQQHASAVQALQECQTLTGYVFLGINNLDKGPFDEVKQRVDACRNKLRLATAPPGTVEGQAQPVSSEPERQEVQATTTRSANLRGGPGTNYPVVGGARQGDKFTVVGRNEKGDWLQVNGPRGNRVWIATFLVQTDGDTQQLPVVSPPAAPVPAATQVAVTTPAASP